MTLISSGGFIHSLLSSYPFSSVVSDFNFFKNVLLLMGHFFLVGHIHSLRLFLGSFLICT